MKCISLLKTTLLAALTGYAVPSFADTFTYYNGTNTVTASANANQNIIGDSNAGDAQNAAPSTTGTLTISGSGVNVNGDDRAGTYVQDRYAAFLLGVAAGDTGTLNITNKSSTSSTYDYGVGFNGTGTININTGGTLGGAGAIYLGKQTGGVGTLTVDGGTNVGAANGSAVSIPNLLVGAGQSSTGTASFNNGATGTFSTTVTVANGASSTGTMNVASGSTVTTVNLNLGVGTSSIAALNVTGGGTLKESGTGNGNIEFGQATNSTATVLISGAGSSLTSAGNLFLANASGSAATVTVSAAGTLTEANTLAFGASGATATLNIGSATLASPTTGGTVSVGGGISTQGSTTGVINFNQTDAFIFTGSNHTINGGITVNQRGTGTTTLDAANTYTGVTTVSAGTLLATNTSGSGTGTGAVNVTGGTLGGTGSIAGVLTLTGGQITGATVGTIGALTLTSTSAATLGNGSTYLVDISATTSDKLALSGPLAITAGAKLTFSGTTGAATYDLANYTSETGTFAVTNLPSGYSLNYGATELDLVAAVPEPSTWLAGVLCLGGLGLHLRRRMVSAI